MKASAWLSNFVFLVPPNSEHNVALNVVSHVCVCVCSRSKGLPPAIVSAYLNVPMCCFSGSMLWLEHEAGRRDTNKLEGTLSPKRQDVTASASNDWASECSDGYIGTWNENQSVTTDARYFGHVHSWWRPNRPAISCHCHWFYYILYTYMWTILSAVVERYMGLPP